MSQSISYLSDSVADMGIFFEEPSISFVRPCFADIFQFFANLSVYILDELVMGEEGYRYLLVIRREIGKILFRSGL